jgi:hypothetical protein
MEIRLKERLSKIDARKIPKAVFGVIIVAVSFGFVMFLRQFDQDKKEK